MLQNPNYLDTYAHMTTAVLALLNTFEPLAKLSAGRKRELAGLCFVEKVSQGINPLRMNISNAKQAVYLIKGELELRFINDEKVTLRGDDTAARHPIVCDQNFVDSIARTDIEILRIDNDLLDIMMTWDQLSTGDDVLKSAHKTNDGKSNRTPVEGCVIQVCSVLLNCSQVFLVRYPSPILKRCFSVWSASVPLLGK